MVRKGLNPQHLGLITPNGLIIPPSQSALAFIGTRRKKTLDNIIQTLSQDVKDKKIDIEDTPLLAHYLKQEN